MASKIAILFAVLGLLVFGCINTLATKIQYTMYSTGRDGLQHPFTKPWFGNFTMFIAMSFGLVVNSVIDTMHRRRQQPDTVGGKPLLQGDKAETVSQTKAILLVGIPASFDLVASGLARTGLLYMSSSIWQMLRGSMIIFSALISVPLLGRKLYCYHWIGVLTCVAGITCVGYANILDTAATSSSSAGSSDAWFGIVLVMSAQVIQAAQIVVEEKILRDLTLPPMKIVGCEGVWGATLCVLVLFPMCWLIPGSDNGHLEDELDTLTLIKNNASLQGILIMYTISCAAFNCAGMFVTSSLSAVHRTMLEATRTAAIWMFDLGVYYFVSKDIAFGEAWTEHSYMQLGGFLLVAFGQTLYGGMVKLPGLYYPPPPKAANWESPVSVREGIPMPSEIVDDINLEESTGKP